MVRDRDTELRSCCLTPESMAGSKRGSRASETRLKAVLDFTAEKTSYCNHVYKSTRRTSSGHCVYKIKLQH